MVAYLTSDQDIQKPFLRDELLPRLAEMLLCVLKQLVSTAMFCAVRVELLYQQRVALMASCTPGARGKKCSKASVEVGLFLRCYLAPRIFIATKTSLLCIPAHADNRSADSVGSRTVDQA